MADYSDRIRELTEGAVPAATVRARTSDWKDWVDRCDEKGWDPESPTVPQVAEYFAWQSDPDGRNLAPSTLRRRRSSLGWKFRQLGVDPVPTADPMIDALLRGARREAVAAGFEEDQATPISVDVLRRMLAVQPIGLAGLRNRALLLVGFASALRRQELADIDVEHVTFPQPDLMIVRIPWSKGDQDAQGQQVVIDAGAHEQTCPVNAYRNWVDAAEIVSGPLFRRVDKWGNVGSQSLAARSVNLVVKEAVSALGLDADEYSSHSLRAGLATAARWEDIPREDVQKALRHRRADTTSGYERLAASGQLRGMSARVGL